jgi:serine/threonine protein phosphatase PrpC
MTQKTIEIDRCIVCDFAAESICGCSVNNPLKVNQDSYIICKDILSENSCETSTTEYERSQAHLFAVCDGHGDDGKGVSNYIKTKFPGTVKDWSICIGNI